MNTHFLLEDPNQGTPIQLNQILDKSKMLLVLVRQWQHIDPSPDRHPGQEIINNILHESDPPGSPNP